MGVGKSTVGAHVAARLGWPFHDTDRLIEARAGKTVRAIFETEGEPAFRAYERALAAEIAAMRAVVVATGGGMLMDPATRALLTEHCFVVALTAPFETVRGRIATDDGRPLARTAESLFAARAPVYAGLPHQVANDREPPDAAAERIIALWRASSV
jgi:shikimate kinase